MPSLHEVERSHDEWGTTPSLMPSLLPCEAAAYNPTTGTAITTVVGSPCDADDPINIVHRRTPPATSTDVIDASLPPKSTCLVLERDVPASRYESDPGGGGTTRVDGTLTNAIVFPSPPCLVGGTTAPIISGGNYP